MQLCTVLSVYSGRQSVDTFVTLLCKAILFFEINGINTNFWITSQVMKSISKGDFMDMLKPDSKKTKNVTAGEVSRFSM